MNVARGRNVFSLLQKGFGARTGASALITNNNYSFLGGFQFPSSKQEEVEKNSTVGDARRLLSTRARRPGTMIKKKSAPTMEDAKAMPLSCKEMNNSDLVMLGAVGNTSARKEMLIRHIMAVDTVSYETACETFQAIAEKNREGMWLLTVPYKVSIAVAVTAAACSFPMVFDINTVTWFNEFYVTADVPEPKDLETPLEVGSWAWNWMEPPLGQISFVLLCLQFTRSQIENIGIRPYTRKIMAMRADNLAKAFPRYDAQVIMDFSESVVFYDSKHGIQSFGYK